MRSYLVRALLFVCVSAPFAGQSDQWHKYKSIEGNFSVLMPVEPQDTANPSEGGRVSHTIQAVADGNIYLIVYVNLSAEQPVNDATFNVYRDTFMKSLPYCATVREDPGSPAVQGYIGHSYLLKCDIQGNKKMFTGNLYWGKHRAYAVWVIYPGMLSAPPAAKKFTDSFSLIDNSK